MYVCAYEGLGQDAPSINVDRATRLNRQYTRSLGWQAHRNGIVRLLGLTATADERTFAEAVARWQSSQNLAVDGVVGPDTWSVMQVVLGLAQRPAGGTFDVARAVRLNRQYAGSPGWQSRFDRIVRFLGFTTRTPGEREFAEAVARWQRSQNLVADGVIGRDTWARMRVAITARGLSRAFPPVRPSLGQIPAHRCGCAPGLPVRAPWARCRTISVTSGHFGIALRWFTDVNCVPNQVMRLLKLSSTFMRMVPTLDNHYIAFACLPGGWENWSQNANGVFTSGPCFGRRVFAVDLNEFGRGSQFQSADSLDNPVSYDRIVLKPPPSEDPPPVRVGKYIERIAHETTHAYHFFTRSRLPDTAPIADKIHEDIAEEAETRRTEERVISEIQARGELRDFVKNTGSPAEHDVERDPFPSELRRTYLEHFVFSELMLAAIRRERLNPDSLPSRNTYADSIPLEDRALDSYLQFPTPAPVVPRTGLRIPFFTDYARLHFLRRVVDARWQRFSPLWPPPEGARTNAMRQEHADAFFRDERGNQIYAYTP